MRRGIGARRLYLLRHAKSSWDEPGLADHDRPLAPRGRRATKLMAKHLASEGVMPEIVLCSAARRTRETLEGIAAALGDESEVKIERDLYGATSGELLERLRRIPEPVQSAMLIGHNPGIHDLALDLAARGEAMEELERKYPTGALATFALGSSWHELQPGAAELLDFVKPRDLS